MKTTIPEGVVEFLELSDKAELEWKMDVDNNERSTTIKRKTVNRVAHKDYLNADNFPFRSVANNNPNPHSYKNSIHHGVDNPNASHYNSGQRLFNEHTHTENKNGLTVKLEEIKRLARPYLQPDILDEKLIYLSQRVKSGTESEALVDECLVKARSMTGMMEAINLLFTSKPSSTAEEDPLYIHRSNLRLRQMSEATRLRLAEIKRVLNSYLYAPDSWNVLEDLIDKCAIIGENLFLADALEYHKRKARSGG